MQSKTMNTGLRRWTFGPTLLLAFWLARSTPADEPLRVLILSGRNVHDWKTTTPELQRIYEASGRFRVVEVVNEPATCTPVVLSHCDVVVCNWTAHPEMHGHPWGAAAETALSDFVRGGKGFVAFHAASTAYYDWDEFQQMVALTWKWEFTSHTAYTTFKVGTDMAPEAKAFLCQQLALIATPEQVPAISPLLLDASCSDPARGVLESIPALAAGDALRRALPQAEGHIRLGLINSLGNRAEAESVELLTPFLVDVDEAIVASAAAALGKIGNDQALRVLAAAWERTAGPSPSRDALADALQACADKLGTDHVDPRFRRVQRH